jgi:hypothetical protein
VGLAQRQRFLVHQCSHNSALLVESREVGSREAKPSVQSKNVPARLILRHKTKDARCCSSKVKRSLSDLSPGIVGLSLDNLIVGIANVCVVLRPDDGSFHEALSLVLPNHRFVLVLICCGRVVAIAEADSAMMCLVNCPVSNYPSLLVVLGGMLRHLPRHLSVLLSRFRLSPLPLCMSSYRQGATK